MPDHTLSRALWWWTLLVGLGACSRNRPAPIPPPPPPQVHWLVLGGDGLFWSVDRSAWVADPGLAAGVALTDGAHRDGVTVVGNDTSLWARTGLDQGSATWSEYRFRQGSRLGGVAADPARFVAVAVESAFGRTYTSTDGTTWLEEDLPDSETVYALGWSGAHFFIGGRLRSVKSPAMWSGAPGVGWMTWRLGQMLDPDRFSGVAPGVPPVAFGTDASGHVAWRVQGEQLLAAVTLGGGTPTGLAYGAGRWLIVGRDGADGRVWWSDDGAVSFAAGATGSMPLHDVAYGDGHFVAVGDQALVLESPTGLPGSWTAVPSPPGAVAALRRIVYVP